MPKSVRILLILLIAGCSDRFPEEDFRPGPNGEPPKALSHVYSGKFVASQRSYVKVLGEIHAFLIDNQFHAVYTSCFNDVLDIRKTSIRPDQKSVFPCVALQSEQGVPVKTYLSVTIENTWFNQLDNNNRLEYTVAIYGKKSMVNEFKISIEPGLITLCSDSEGQCRTNYSLRSQFTTAASAIPKDG